MDQFLLIFSAVLILLSILPFVKNQHWVFRVPEFIKIQLLIVQSATLMLCVIFVPKDLWFYIINGLQVALMAYHIYILIRYLNFYKKKKTEASPGASNPITVISTNIYQYNSDFKRFQDFIRKHDPDIFITMESNGAWETANRVMEKDYPHTVKMTLENTYGMHLYSKIPFEKSTIHFFVAEDIPSIEVHLKSSNGVIYTVFAVHPPPPSPTEETTSKERDGDLLCVAKKIKEHQIPSLVIGDFNTVAWSETSILFRKTSELIDARVGRGILATFHAKYWFFRVPLDLLFHSPEITIEKLKTLEDVGSDHFPIFCEFYLNPNSTEQQDEVKTLEKGEAGEVEELIEEGKNEVTDNRNYPN